MLMILFQHRHGANIMARTAPPRKCTRFIRFREVPEYRRRVNKYFFERKPPIMKNNKKRGFTIVELVIVIAVIAILAAVLIPTFSNVIQKANESKALQTARNAYYDWLSTNDADGKAQAEHLEGINCYIQSGEYYFTVTKGQFDAKATKGTADADVTHFVLKAEATDGVYSTTPVKTGSEG